jgi:hypothetical protein
VGIVCSIVLVPSSDDGITRWILSFTNQPSKILIWKASDPYWSGIHHNPQLPFVISTLGGLLYNARKGIAQLSRNLSGDIAMIIAKVPRR